MSTTKRRTGKNEEERVIWGGDDPFTHALVVGPTRCGKTSTILQPMVYEILKKMKNGEKVGLSMIEPKGDVVRMVREMAIGMGLEHKLTYIDPEYPELTQRINVMKGDKNDVAESTVAVLKSLFGKQDAFFATVQELSSRKVTLLLKELRGDDMDILDVLENLRDPDLLSANVDTLRANGGSGDLISFFDNELLGSGQMADKYRQFIVGLRAQLENITSNEHLRAIVTGKSDIDLDDHFESGGILAVNTALGKLGKSGDAFGMFIAMHLQLATFRRPGEERTRVPHYLIFDEYSRYINPDVERFLSIAASYRVALIAAIQSLGQLEIESGNTSAKAMKRAILTSTRNKIVFGGLEYEDAEEVSRIMGKDVIMERKKKYDGGILQNVLPKMYEDTEEEKERYYSTFLMDGLPRFHFVAKLLKDGTPQEPFVGVGDFVPRDWLEKLTQEQMVNTKTSLFDWRGHLINRALRLKQQEQEEQVKKARLSLLESNPFEEEEAVDTDSLNEQFKIKHQEILAEREEKPVSEEPVKQKTPEKVVFHIGSSKQTMNASNEVAETTSTVAVMEKIEQLEEPVSAHEEFTSAKRPVENIKKIENPKQNKVKLTIQEKTPSDTDESEENSGSSFWNL